MTRADAAALARTPFASFHREHGAKMVEFAGWEMPLHYGSILREHRQVRTSGGIFDVSHMGRFTLRGRDAEAFLDRVCTRRIAGMADGQARYSIVCNPRGGCHDDVLVYRQAEGEFLMVCNAANREKLLEHFDGARGDLVFDSQDLTTRSAMVAVQGPRVMEVIGRYSSEIPRLKRYRFLRRNIFGLDVLVSRTGYTGEDGVEVIINLDSVPAKLAMKLLINDLSALEDVLQPAGLGARDSLRLEAAMALYGHEITEEIDPLSAGLAFAVALDKPAAEGQEEAFIGQTALRRIAAEGPRRRLVGLVLDSRRAARPGMEVRLRGVACGTVTSGCLSPTLGASIAMAYLDRAAAVTGGRVQVALGRQDAEAEIVELPFYKKRG